MEQMKNSIMSGRKTVVCNIQNFMLRAAGLDIILL